MLLSPLIEPLAEGTDPLMISLAEGSITGTERPERIQSANGTISGRDKMFF